MGQRQREFQCSWKPKHDDALQPGSVKKKSYKIKRAPKGFLHRTRLRDLTNWNYFLESQHI